ncbi:MAG: DNA replication and repair protein RecF [Gemmatimonadetes bacterium]|nr:DNA replication and repair protein RecF [Gemmatimonadota bacterium]
MHLTDVRLDHFRNLASVRLDVPPGGAILVGDNGQGKTNFLEAVHYLSLFRSFRGARHDDAIAFEAEHFRVEGGVEYVDGGRRTVAVAADRGRRRVAVDGVEASPLSDAVGSVLSVVVAPDDSSLVTGPPGGRRRYLDTLLGLTSRGYARGLRDYDRILRQRNELLRGPERASGPVMASWDESLVTTGAPLVAARATLVRRLAERFAAAAGAIAGAEERTDYGLAFRPSVPIDEARASDREAVAAAWAEALAAAYGEDRARGWTTVGFHRDDLSIRLGSRPLDRFGSQGERRTAAIALRLLEARVLEDDTRHSPILLLDDVFSELDEGRARRLLEWLGEGRQRFVTSPRPLPDLDVGGSLARWRVRSGRIVPAA